MSEGFRTIVIAAAGVALAVTWLSVHAVRTPLDSPTRLVRELRLAQMAAAVLAFTAAVYWGFAILHEHRPGVGIDVALATGFLVIAALAPLLDPRRALTTLATAFVSHALIDILHRPNLLPDDIVPRWYIIGCAVYDVALGVACYLPLLGRRQL